MQDNICLEYIHPFNIKGRKSLSRAIMHQFLFFEPYTYSLPFFKTVCNILFWDCHQLLCCILLNLIHGISMTISALVKARRKLSNLDCWQTWAICFTKEIRNKEFLFIYLLLLLKFTQYKAKELIKAEGYWMRCVI